MFGSRELRHFSAFTNVQRLKLERVDIFRFFPEVARYFGQFSPTLQSIALFAPHCTPRQLTYFLSLFSNLDDIEIRGFSLPLKTSPCGELVPVSAPKLRGRLVVASFREVEIWEDLIASCDGLRFRAMDLRMVGGCAPVLLEACSETLETLRFFPVDAFGESSTTGLPSVGLTATARVHRPPSLLPDFDLSRLKALRSLHFKIRAIPSGSIGQDVLVEVFSTITSPLFSEVTITVEVRDIPSLPVRVALFKTLRAMNHVRPFNLVFSLVALDYLLEEARQKLVGALDLATSNGSLDFLSSPPTIRCRTRRLGV